MLPTPKEFCNLLDNILTNSPLGNPTKANLYKTYGYYADTPVIPLNLVPRISRYYGKTLHVNITLSKKGHLIQWTEENPSISDIIKALKSVKHGIPHSFVILSKSPKSYIQANVTCLEYQDGSLERHYFCPPEYLCSAKIQKAFLSYAQDCPWWEKQILWKKGFAP